MPIKNLVLFRIFFSFLLVLGISGNQSLIDKVFAQEMCCSCYVCGDPIVDIGPIDFGGPTIPPMTFPAGGLVSVTATPQACGTGRINLSWNNTNDWYYRIYDANTNSLLATNSINFVTGEPAPTSYVFSGQLNTTYSFYVTSESLGGVGPKSATVSATTLACAPPPPTVNIWFGFLDKAKNFLVSTVLASSIK